MKQRKCPKCQSDNNATFMLHRDYSKCLDCGHKDKTTAFEINQGGEMKRKVTVLCFKDFKGDSCPDGMKKEVFCVRQVYFPTEKKGWVWREKIERSGVAIFHQFGMSFKEFENGPGNFTTAIVEWPGGTVEAVDAEMIRFIDPPEGDE